MWRWTSLAMVVACGSVSVQRSVQLSTTTEVEAKVEAPAAHPQEAPLPGLALSPGAPPPTAPGNPPAAKPEYLAAGLLEGDVALSEGWKRWHAGSATTFDAIFEIAVLANRARPLETSDELMVIALADAVEASDCDPERLGKVRLMAIMVRGAVHPHELDAELARLADLGPVECEKLR